MGAPRVVAGQPHRLHHRFGARHVERDFVQSADRLQALRVGQHARVVAAENRPQGLHPIHALRDALLVEVVAEDVDPVGPGQIEERVAVQVLDRHARGRLHEAAGLQPGAQVRAELERDAVAAGELKVREVLAGLTRHRNAAGEPLQVQRLEPVQARAAPCHHLRRRPVDAKEPVLVVGVPRNPSATRLASLECPPNERCLACESCTRCTTRGMDQARTPKATADSTRVDGIGLRECGTSRWFNQID